MHQWDEADLVVVIDLSDMLLDLICHYFIQDFCIDFIKEIGLKFSFLDMLLSGFWMSIILAS
jgi:hypothetical protein